MPDVVPQYSADGLQPMERALLLQASPLTVGATSAQVMRLAMIAQDVPLTLGSVIVRQLATQFGGEPHYERRPGGGLSVSVSLPGIESATSPEGH